MAAAAICMKMGHHHPPPQGDGGRLPGRNQEGVYDPNHCGVPTPDTWTLLLHLNLSCLESGTWMFASPGTWSHNSSCHVWKLLRRLDVIRRLRRCKGRESAPPERKALPRMLKAAEGIACPPPPQTYTCRQMQKKRGLRHHDPPTLLTGGFPPSTEAGGGEASDSEPASMHRQLDC